MLASVTHAAHGGTLELDGRAPGRTTSVVSLPLNDVIERSSGPAHH
jgi:hypothetical protein